MVQKIHDKNPIFSFPGIETANSFQLLSIPLLHPRRFINMG